MNWIWNKNQTDKNYVEFIDEFEANNEDVFLKISADRQYVVFVNGHMVSNGQFSDAKGFKSAVTVNISQFVKSDKNELFVIAYHSDSDFAQARTLTPGIAFEITEKNRIILTSSEKTKCRISPKYHFSDCVTPQLGYGYKYDFNKNSKWEKACIAEDYGNIIDRPIKSCSIYNRIETEIVAQGVFMYKNGKTDAELVQNAWLSSMRFSEMTGLNRLLNSRFQQPLAFNANSGDGIYVLVDLLREETGYLCFSLTVENKCKAIITWGEHLSDLRIRSAMGGRNFASTFILKQGKNTFEDYLHRLGGRYICIFVESSNVEIEYLSIRPSLYPFKIVDRRIDDLFLEKIYNTAKRTLELCAHEHYEDCPWREQAFYAMDARNHALFGYSAFKEYELPRALLRLIAQSIRNDGLPELCSPAVARITIPSYAPYWIIALKENAEVDFKKDFVLEMLPFAEKMVDTFIEHTKEYGVESFIEPSYWNFHEWSEGMDGGNFNRTEKIEPYGDGKLTSLVIIASECLVKLEKVLHREGVAKKYQEYAIKLGKTLEKYFDRETGLYNSIIKNHKREGLHCSVLSAFVLTGKIPKNRLKKICNELKYPKQSIPSTIGELQFKYEAILRIDQDREYCLNDVCEIYGRMLNFGATTFWETENGEADFNDAGSLCHAWSSVACWLFDKIGIAKIN